MWAKRFGNGASQIGRGLAIGGGGRVTLVGEMSGSADFGGGRRWPWFIRSSVACTVRW